MIHSTVSAPKGEKTKYRLAESMKECMKTTPVEEITVRQICEICGVTRQTFYRNFLDKYDLINWYFDKLLTKSFEHMGRGTTVFDSLEKKFTYIQKEKAFFAAAFRYDKQNSLREHDFDLILAFYTGNAFSSRNVLSGFHHHDRKMGAYRHGSDTFRVCRSSRPGNAGRLKKTVPESAAALLERVSKWGLQIAEMVFQTRSGYFSQILFCCFCHNGDFF
jgi:AcrR family transcriptional regulator